MAYLSREGIMLCYPADDRRISRLPETVLAQPKLNGERCRVEWFQGEPVLLSSYGNEFKGLEHIKDALARYPELPWDGELYVHGWSREKIHSTVSRKKNASANAKEMQFHIFDIQDLELTQAARSAKILAHIPFRCDESVQGVSTAIIERYGWLDYCKIFVDKGYEGIILRHPGAGYELKRSVNILKFKPTEFDIYTIVGCEQEVSIAGELKESLGSFLVTSDEGTVFSVGTGPALTKQHREMYWKLRGELSGKQLKVKHELLRTVNDIPIACVAVEVLL